LPGANGPGKENSSRMKSDRQQSVALPTGPFKFLPNEALKGHPLVKFQINEDGTESNVRLVRGCGVRDIKRK
jgi:hypothetical protein